MTFGWAQFVAAFLGCGVLSLVLTPKVMRLATRFNILDVPGEHKSHVSPVPYLGGLAIVCSFVLIVGGLAIIDNRGTSRNEVLLVLGTGMLLAIMGLIDDLRRVPVLPRLAAEILAGVALVALDVGASFTGIRWLDVSVTIVWTVGIINAVNMTDNMDALSSGLVVVASLTFFAIAVGNDQYLVATLAASLAGCALGFLRHNYHPARIYMGDAGSYFLGFLVAYIGLKVQFRESDQANTFIVPVVVCAVLIFDATLVTVSRIYHGVSPFKGGRDHTSHRLVKIGLPIRVAVGTIHAFAASCGVIAYVVTRVPVGPGWVLIGWLGAVLLLVGSALALVPVYETSTHQLFRFERQGATSEET